MDNDLNERILDEWHGLLFGVRRSIRYHCRRREFFDQLGRWQAVLSILFGGLIVFFVQSKPSWFVVPGVIMAMLSAFNLAIGYSKTSREHYDLEKAFIDIEKGMAQIGVSPTERDLAEYKTKRLEIEAKEPPKKSALDVMCHNELIVAMDFDRGELCPLKWHHRLFAQIHSFHGASFDKIKNCAARTP